MSGGTYTQSTISSSVGSPSSVAVDASGNIYVADPGDSRVLKETVLGSSYTQSTIGSSFSTPDSVAVDATGNVYVADTGNSQITFPPTYQPIGSVFMETPSGNSYTQSTIVSGLSDPNSLAVDGGNNLYISTYGTPDNPESSQILKEAPAGGSYTQTLVGATAYFLVGQVGIGVDAGGDVFLTTFNSIVEVTQSAGNAGTVNVGAASSTVSLIFNFDSAGSISAPAVVTQGATGLDFFDASTGSCIANNPQYPYLAGESCTVDVTMSPLLPGPRYGAAVLRSTTGNVIATGYIHGTGSAPQVNFPPGTQSTLPFSSVVSPYAVAADSSGNLYIAELPGINNPSVVVKETLTGNGYTQSTVATGFQDPVGVAVDGAGNVFIADEGTNQLVEATPLSGGGYTQSTLFSGYFLSLAVDGSGNLYVGTLGSGVLKETPIAGGYSQSIIAPTVDASGIAVDGQGNVYLSDSDNNRVLKETLSPTAVTPRARLTAL